MKPAYPCSLIMYGGSLTTKSREKIISVRIWKRNWWFCYTSFWFWKRFMQVEHNFFYKMWNLMRLGGPSNKQVPIVRESFTGHFCFACCIMSDDKFQFYWRRWHLLLVFSGINFSPLSNYWKIWKEKEEYVISKYSSWKSANNTVNLNWI